MPRRPVEREMQVTTSETTYRKTRVKKAGAAIRSEFHRSLLNVSCRAQPARAGSKLKDGFDGKEMDRLGGSGLTNERTGILHARRVPDPEPNLSRLNSQSQSLLAVLKRLVDFTQVKSLLRQLPV